MNNRNKFLAVLSLCAAGASSCMERRAGLPLPDQAAFSGVSVAGPSLLELTSRAVFGQIDGYIKDVASQPVDPEAAADELFLRYISEDYFDDCLKKRFINAYATKQFGIEGRSARFYDGRVVRARELKLATTFFEQRLQQQSPLHSLNARALVALLIRVEHAKVIHGAYPN